MRARQNLLSNQWPWAIIEESNQKKIERNRLAMPLDERSNIFIITSQAN